MSIIEKLASLFKGFPGVGPKSAIRFVYYLLKLPQEKIEELAKTIQDLKNKIKICAFCFYPFEGQGNLCPVCADPSRNRKLLCLVEKESDLIALEKTKKYNGLYFILGGTVGTMREEELSSIRIEELKKRIERNNFSEIIIGLNPTPEGKVTSLIIESTIKEIKKNQLPKITHLARGIPTGGEIEYADIETLENALEGRK